MPAHQNTDTTHHAPALPEHKVGTSHSFAPQSEHHSDHVSDKTDAYASSEAHHHLAQEAFAPPHKLATAAQHQEHVKDRMQERDGDMETFKQNTRGVHHVIMQLSPARQADNGADHAPGNQSRPQPDLVVASDGSLKWHSKKPQTASVTDHILGHLNAKDKPLVVAFEPATPSPGRKDGALSTRQIDRMKEMVAYLGDRHTHTEIDQALQDKAHMHMIPTTSHDKVHEPVLVSSRRHGGHDPASGRWSGGNGSLYKNGRSQHLVTPPASALAHLGSEGHEETKFMQTVSPTDRPQIKNFVDKLVWAISGNEGNYTTINPNDAGCGISIGIRQWNQKSGELPSLLHAWHDQDPAKFAAIFGRYGSSLLNERFVRGTDFWRQPGLMDDIKKALADQEFQQVQLNLARQFVVNSVQLGYDSGFRSELALADIADVINQCGSGGFTRALRHGMKSAGSEKNSVVSMEHILHRPNGMQRLSALSKSFSASAAANVATG